jgi:hypothetical protein
MKILPTKFRQKGFELVQLQRDNDKAIYKKAKSRNKIVSYEVIIISSHNGYQLGTQYIEPAETYPSDSLWGVKGWTFTTQLEAESFFKDLKTEKRLKAAKKN